MGRRFAPDLREAPVERRLHAPEAAAREGRDRVTVLGHRGGILLRDRRPGRKRARRGGEVSEANRGSSQPAQTKVPARISWLSGLVPARDRASSCRPGATDMRRLIRAEPKSGEDWTSLFSRRAAGHR